MIADRMGQFASGTSPEMLDQARSLFVHHADADLAYMDRRIRHEAGEEAIMVLRGSNPDQAVPFEAFTTDVV